MPLRPSESRDSPRLLRARALYRSGQTREAVAYLANCETWDEGDTAATELLVLRGRALADSGEVVRSIETLRTAQTRSRRLDPSAQFDVLFALFVRESDFQVPEAALPGLACLRQLAASVGDAGALARLHLAVARLEGCRGHCVDAYRHVAIAQRLAERNGDPALRCAVDLAEAALEAIAGNLTRSKAISIGCLDRAESHGYSTLASGAGANLALLALISGNPTQARLHLAKLMNSSRSATYVHLAALDSLAQVELHEDQLDDCRQILERCNQSASADDVPARSWNDLASDITRSYLAERLGEMETVLDLTAAADPEMERRHFKALRTSILCARARTLARLGRHREADATLTTALSVCPRGAVDPLIVLEASRGLCLNLRGDWMQGARHLDHALAACQAIGHRYYEAWIDKQNQDVGQPRQEPPPAPVQMDLSSTSLLLSDVAAVLAAGHSVDLLARRAADILKATPLGKNLTVNRTAASGPASPACEWRTQADGTYEIHLKHRSDGIVVRVTDVTSLEEVALLKSLADLMQTAVNRGNEQEADDNLWPQSTMTGDEDTVFRSPRMLELLRIATRLATSNVPVLISGETGTGKEVLARLVHDQSRANRGPFVPFNCSAIPKELVESQLFGHRRGAFTGALDSSPGVVRAAEHGTLFMDEIGDLDIGIQPKLLRFLESGEVHPVGEPRSLHVKVRVVAATNADLESLVQQGQFRSDLYYRVGVATVNLPPLRERKDEIPALAALFLDRYSAECGRSGLRLADDFIAALVLYHWPGNIRQLANEVRRCIAMADDGQVLTAKELAPVIVELWQDRPASVAVPIQAGVRIGLDQTLSSAAGELEEKFIQHAMDATGGRVADAARLLGLSRKGLFLKRRRRGMVQP